MRFDIILHLLFGINNWSLAGETKVTERRVAAVINEDVCRLNIPVYNIGRMQVSQGTEQVIHDNGDMILCEA